ncbi:MULTISPECIES: hypothetical protein [unclassified Moorena]|nr:MULTISPECIES: hypothetical protein [unclassified Moorena]NER86857.1 hypothetical protein [Moorena sp. SIO3A2]NET63512.1 hypothetical protein [Moorena sp. SIO1G6]
MDNNRNNSANALRARCANSLCATRTLREQLSADALQMVLLEVLSAIS